MNQAAGNEPKKAVDLAQVDGQFYNWAYRPINPCLRL